MLLINVPADITNTVSMLPRLSVETGTIKVNSKKRLQYKSSALSQYVIKTLRPHKPQGSTSHAPIKGLLITVAFIGKRV